MAAWFSFFLRRFTYLSTSKYEKVVANNVSEISKTEVNQIMVKFGMKMQVSQNELYSGIPNVCVASVTKSFTLKGVQTIHRSRCSRC
jgi:hypothetical protein